MDDDRSPGLPTRRERLAILAHEASGFSHECDVDLELLATLTCGFTSSDLANLCRLARDAASGSGCTSVSMADFADALEDSVLAGARTVLLDGHERLLAAYEVAGRTLIAWRVWGMKPARRLTILCDESGDTYEDAARLDSEQNGFLASIDLTLAGTATQEFARVDLTYRAEGQPVRALELAELYLASQGVTQATIEGQASCLVDERRREILRQLSEVRNERDRLADLLVREEAVEVAEAVEILGRQQHDPKGMEGWGSHAAAGQDEITCRGCDFS